MATLLAGLAVRSSVLAGEAGATSANFLKIAVGARAVGMGETFTAVADDSLAVNWNPAGLALPRGWGLSTGHVAWMQGVNHEVGSFRFSMKRAGGLGLSVNYLGTGSFPSQLETPSGAYGGQGENISASDLALGLAYGQRLGRWVPGTFFHRTLLGLKATYVNQRAQDVKAGAASVDLGGLFEIKKRTSYFGMTLVNAGSKLGDRSQPLIWKAGLSYKLRKIARAGDTLLMALETDSHNDTGFHFNLGTEYSLPFGKQTFALRAGYRVGGDLGGQAGLTAGAGWKLPLGGADAALDYAFVPYGLLGQTHRITLGLESGLSPLPPEASLEVPASFTPAREVLNGKMGSKSPEGPGRWILSLRDSEDKEKRRWEGRGEAPPGFTWDGKDGSGRTLPPGRYKLELEVQDQEEQRARSPLRAVDLLVATPAPTAVTAATPNPPKVRYEYNFALSGDILFDSGEAVLRPQASEVLGQAVSILKEKYAESTILVAGHTDDVPPKPDSPFKSNEQISVSRAQAVKDYLVGQGWDGSKIAVIGYGSRAPVAPNDSAEGRAANRRVDLLIYGEKEAGILDLISESKDYMKAKQWLFALKSLLRAAELDRENALVYRMAGTCYFNLGQKDLGLRSLRRALELNPGDEQLKAWLQRMAP